MFRKTIYSALLIAAIVGLCNMQSAQAQQPIPQQQAYGRQYAPHTTAQDYNRFLHYPYVYYPQNFWSQEYYRSSQDPYNRYPAEMRIPQYDKRWMNYYPEQRRYHMGHHFFLDVM